MFCSKIFTIHNTSCTYYVHLTLQFTELGAGWCPHDIRQCPSPLTLPPQVTTEGGRTGECSGPR